MNNSGAEHNLREKIFSVTTGSFDQLAMAVFSYQFECNWLYREFCGLMRRTPQTVKHISEIPFLPISFFKTHDVVTGHFEEKLIFESSGTTGMVSSRHLIKDPGIYEESFTKCFNEMYGKASEYSILALLPSYLERGNSSLVYMVQKLIAESRYKNSGFYLADGQRLKETLLKNESEKTPTLLIGVTYALLDFAEQHQMNLQHTIVMETGGMKGRNGKCCAAKCTRS